MLSMDFGKSAPSSTAPSAAKSEGTSAFDGKPVAGGPDDCPRCGKRVYAAEKKLAAGRVCFASFDIAIIRFIIYLKFSSVPDCLIANCEFVISTQ